MDSLQYKVLEFDMPGDDFDPNFTPEDGLQYLQQVVYERQRCPAVVVKPLPVGALAALPAIPTPSWSGLKPNSTDEDADRPDIHRPTAEWKQIQYAEFAQLREQIAQLRPQFASRLAANRGTAAIELPLIDDRASWREFLHTNRPLLSTMLRLDQPSLEQILDYQLEWLANDDDADDEATRGDEASWDLDSLAAVGRWIYSLLGCLHSPLEPTVHSTLRDIAKAALRIRNGLAADDDGAAMAAPLNLLVCIIANNFGQADLAERV